MSERLPFKGDIKQMSFNIWSLTFVAEWITDMNAARKTEEKNRHLINIFEALEAIFNNTTDDDLMVAYENKSYLIHFTLYLCSRTLNHIQPNIESYRIEAVTNLIDMLEKAVCFGYQGRSTFTNIGLSVVQKGQGHG